jgi:hypothetical protein
MQMSKGKKAWKRLTKEAQCEVARREAEERGYAVDSVTWSSELGAPVVTVFAHVQSVAVEA